jgi:mRNA-degrading endonuclease toxin of MazEF toxin-antitoxin module
MTPSRSEIYFVNLNPVSGREQSGTRPVLVLSRNEINALPLANHQASYLQPKCKKLKQQLNIA